MSSVSQHEREPLRSRSDRQSQKEAAVKASSAKHVEQLKTEQTNKDGNHSVSDKPSAPTISRAEREALAALTGETVTDETLYAVPEEEEGEGGHVSAFGQPLEQPEQPAEGSRDDADQASITESLVSLRTHAHKVFKKSKKAIRKPASVLSSTSKSKSHEEKWEKAKKGLATLNHDDADVLRQALEVAKDKYESDALYFRKVHTGTYGQIIEWQVKFEHKTRGCKEQARRLKDAARKVKSYLDYKEPGEIDERFKNLYERIQNDKCFSGARILFKEGKGKDLYPWKVRVDHETRGFTKVGDTLARAINAMEEHLEYQEATPAEQDGVIWGRIFKLLERYNKCKVFFKEGMEDGPEGEPEKVWYMKIDHPNRGIQFEAKSRIFEEAAGQIYDYLKVEKEVTKTIA